MNIPDAREIRMIPLDKITVVNPRVRGQKKFRQIANNIANIGLKKPITVTPKPGTDDEYLLVCGQGRYEAYETLGQKEIPAIVIEVSEDKLLLMSLVENLARRNPSCVEMVHEIGALKERGYSFADIARKTDLAVSYIRGIVKLIERGEERLVMAVERGQIPVSVAVTIAVADDHDIQRALTEAYESNDLRGKKLLATRRLIEKRQTDGKSLRSGPRRAVSPVSGKKLLETYQAESAKQRLVVQKSKLCETRLLFVVSAIRQLVEDKVFVDLLRTENLDTMPAYLVNELTKVTRLV
ncbi:plasmid partitioning protein RepB C-terminal domain-containing protein [Allorhodopirellula heiligendammensis]|uniref:Chromosome-partitioning protein Spo0J n=1 Tax=Allorhodopirellula heiligendammensis TaxID=2714739 RepID=A0A5C6C2H2_9BACT|nr:plasmid partitioning protein RepB C-terminal domain-containing protein [Allorhodopirellula heiligendammensis]TWU18285.1 Chromosome-partitioning protein Spo0J [Allorhodopirellula heiligendammensis]